jgi:hypothetical protein
MQISGTGSFRSVPNAEPQCASSDAVHIQRLGAAMSSRFLLARSVFTRSSGARIKTASRTRPDTFCHRPW